MVCGSMAGWPRYDAGTRRSALLGQTAALTGKMRRAALRALARLCAWRDAELYGHMTRVQALSLALAHRLWTSQPALGLSERSVDALGEASLMHDLGKIGIPEYILSKPERLTDEEHEVIRRHPILGARILSPVAELAPAIPAVRHHHERFDGGGYPDGLAGEDIPLVARIVSVADAFDAMVRARMYGRSVSEAEAIAEVERSSGTQFDPTVVQAFVDVMRSDRRLGETAG